MTLGIVNTAGDISERIKPLDGNQPCSEVRERLMQDHSTASFPVRCQGRIDRLVHRHVFLEHMAGRYGFALFNDRPFQTWIDVAGLAPSPAVPPNLAITDLARKWQQEARPWIETVALVADGPDYVGVVTYPRLVDGLLSQAEFRRRELTEARDASLAAVALKQEFITNLNHEMLTPLNAIIGFSDLGLAGNPVDHDRDLFAQILQAGWSLRRILDPVLDFSNLERGSLEFRIENMDPRAILDQALDGCVHVVRGKGIELAVATDPAVPGRILADPRRVRHNGV